MARVTYGAFVTELRGSLGGTVFQRNAYGFTGKNKPAMSRLQSTGQNEIHRIVTLVTQFWESITQIQRDAWNAWAASHPVQSVHNPSAILTGYTYFLKYNMVRCVPGNAVLEEPTAGVLTLPPIAPVVFIDSGEVWININAPLDMNYAWSGYLSPPQKKTLAYNTSRTRYMCQHNISTSNVSAYANYIKNFGALPAVGDTVFFEFQPWGLYSPYIPSSQFFTLVVGTI